MGEGNVKSDVEKKQQLKPEILMTSRGKVRIRINKKTIAVILVLCLLVIGALISVFLSVL